MFHLEEKMFLYFIHWWKGIEVYPVNKGHAYKILVLYKLLQQIISLYTSYLAYSNKVRLKMSKITSSTKLQELHGSHVATGKCWHKDL